MKITKIETLVCHARMRNWIFVKVLTDQPGLFGGQLMPVPFWRGHARLYLWYSHDLKGLY